MAGRTLTIYERGYCHLCADMRAALAPWIERFELRLERVDVDAFPELAARYGDLVPVLMEGEVEICHYHLDEAALGACLSGGNGAQQPARGKSA